MSFSHPLDSVLVKSRPVTFSSRGVWKVHALIAVAIVALARFLWWFIQPEHVGDPWLFTMLMVSLGYKVVFWLYEWYLYAGISLPTAVTASRPFTVDVFTTACPGEPEDMIVRTLRAIVAIDYPHNSYLCDEGDSPTLKRACRELGVIHVTRNDRKDAKAGNINNALAKSNGEICVVLDPDHVPQPDFIDRVLGHFEDDRVGFVQTVQGYGNQSESLIAGGAAEQSYMFYGPMMSGMNRWGTVQAIGANCAFRREALNSIGGHAAGLAEDMHTAMRLHARGWKAVYLPEILTRGEVPSTLAAYYKQQLKWSCGCFDLLFQQYPKLWSGFSTANKIHYFLSPLHYLRGFVNLFDFLIPILALIMGNIVLSIRLDDFLLHYLPVLVAVQLVRRQAQNWLADPEPEDGFYLLGGVLKAGSWWIYIVGTLCSIFRIKVPYIPTPKGHRATNAWTLAAPNIALAAISLGAVAYGLDYDWSPYSLAMAGFAIANAIILLFSAAIAQQQLFKTLKTSLSPALVRMVGAAVGRAHSLLPRRRQYALLACAIASIPLVGVLAANTGHSDLVPSETLVQAAVAATGPFSFSAPTSWSGSWSSQTDVKHRDTGPFLLGMFTPAANAGHLPPGFWQSERKLGAPMRVVSLYQEWGRNSLKYFPDEVVQQAWQHGGLPMITWEPWTRDFPEFASDPDLSHDRKVFRAILQGRLDSYLHAYACRLRDYHKPVLLRFAHEPDNPSYPWSTSGGNTPAEYVAAWRYVVNFFKNEGASNVAFVWNPWHPEAVSRYFPGAPYFDWFGLTLLNYGRAAMDGRWRSFDELYEPFRGEFTKLGIDKPTMLAEFGSTSYGGNRAKWLGDAVGSIADRHPEIRGVVFFHSSMDRNWATPWRPPGNPRFIDWTFLDDIDAVARVYPMLSRRHFHDSRRFFAGDYTARDARPTLRTSPFITGLPGRFELLADGKPFYVRGIA
ncbi:MAG TPA: glycosyltransferase [Candidatus Binataceae bacterium]|nr:glycosyltransferase [Candidatus Binataceae bacterium]